ncbi:Na+/H+ antiporter NhaD-like permease [Candidatus Zixiibacteriota bacterium]|nr:Na+/H+ antiporter NhaD-like permease [candidate division Zixibacteria bacterium]
MPLQIIILLAVFLLIAVRKIGNIRFQIWQIMLLGALAVLITGKISIPAAIKAVDYDVILFLFGMFVVGEALDRSGYLAHLTHIVFSRTKNTEQLLLAILVIFGVASAFLMNDTLAIIGTPVVLTLAKKHDVSPKLLLLALAFGVTIGSVVSPIGNPQNLLIAVNGIKGNPFVSFARYLAIPTILCLLVAFLVLRFFYKKEFHPDGLNHLEEPILDTHLASLSKLSIFIILALVGLKILSVFWGIGAYFHLTYIALAGAVPLLLLSKKRIELLRSIDWTTLIFFAAMFVLMAAVWDSGFFQSLLERMHLDITKLTVVLSVSVILSQFISNVPLVALCLPILHHAGAANNEMIALAAGSTIAGNLFILGAASNVIIIQNAEKRAGQTLTFWEFARVGIPLTAANVTIYWLFLRLM